MINKNFKGKSALELREMFPNLEFLDDRFDDAIMGLSDGLDQVIYHEADMIHILMLEIDDDFDNWDYDSNEWCDLYDNCQEEVCRIEPTDYYNLIGAVNPRIYRDSEELDY